MAVENLVKISELKIAQGPETLSTRALGSCVAVCLYDKQRKIGGLCHFILPDSTISREKAHNPAKFADTGIKTMIEELSNKYNIRKATLTAKLVGGAKMFSALGDTLNIGEKNVKAAEKVLTELKIPILSRDTGEDFGRNVKLILETGVVEVSSFRKGLVEI